MKKKKEIYKEIIDWYIFAHHTLLEQNSELCNDLNRRMQNQIQKDSKSKIDLN